MYTPPSTPTKDDKLKELHSIQLEINGENAKLEIIRRERAEAEQSFARTRLELKDKEDFFNRVDPKLRLIVDNQEKSESEHLEKIENLTKDEDALKKSIANLQKQYDDMVDSKEQKSRNLDSVIDIQKHNLRQIEKKTADTTLEKDKLEEENKKITNDSETKTKLAEDLMASAVARKNEADEKMTALEKLKSDLRIWSVRLHSKYGHLMSDVEKRLIPAEETIV